MFFFLGDALAGALPRARRLSAWSALRAVYDGRAAGALLRARPLNFAVACSYLGGSEDDDENLGGTCACGPSSGNPASLVAA